MPETIKQELVTIIHTNIIFIAKHHFLKHCGKKLFKLALPNKEKDENLNSKKYLKENWEKHKLTDQIWFSHSLEMTIL